MKLKIAAIPIAALLAAPLVASDRDWQVYGGNAAGQRYSEAAQINRGNVRRLQEAWRFETGPGGIQTSPIVVGRTLYALTPDQSVIALDAATGKQNWRFTPPTPGFQPVRGVTWWSAGAEQRLFASSSFYLYALDPATGRTVPGFGNNGRIDLREGLGRNPAGLATFLTSPGAIFGDLIIVGFRTSETAPAAPGDIRAYDVRSGQLRWSFRTIPQAGEEGADTWPADARNSSGAANNWAGMAVDQERGIVFVPTGSAVPDFYGANRKGNNLYANSLLALDARTGKRLWHFQAVHHDLWDRDFSAPPSLLTVRSGGRMIDAVAQASKQGLLFVFDRVTGKPIFPIEERPVAASTVPGEESAPTQPFPTLPRPFARQVLTEDMLTTRTPEAHAAVLARFKTVRSDGPFTPFEAGRKTVVFPGFDGGAEWGGAAVDPRRGLLYLNAQDVPWLGGLRKVETQISPAKALYDRNCAACHGSDLKGNPPEFPALAGVAQKLSREQADAIILGGKGRMPGFPQLTEADRKLLVALLFDAPANEGAAFLRGLPPAAIAEFSLLGKPGNEPYQFSGFEKFRDPDGYPAVVPPWGTLNAIDLNSGQYLWTVPLGQYPELARPGQADTGSENYGGPLLTATRLLFIGATIYDRKLRAFDARNGRLLWQTVLPYAGNASPITYEVDGRQFVVIASSGARDPKGPQGSAYIAFALPVRR